MHSLIETYIVDSFTSVPFRGNPAGVCLLEEELSEIRMFNIAKELGLSETAYLIPRDSQGHYSIRFFSPKMEIPLCGHATLATAKVVFQKYSELDNLCFHNIDNLELLITKRRQLIELVFPVYEVYPSTVPQALLAALGLSEVENVLFNQETNILILEILESTLLRDLTPDFAALKKSHNAINGVLVTALSLQSDYDFESRYFWPWSGTNEDPVTGGTHTFLTKYWAKKLKRNKLKSFQCSDRSGSMEVELLNESQFAIRGEARIMLSGSLHL